jgi:hypothetical protein
MSRFDPLSRLLSRGGADIYVPDSILLAVPCHGVEQTFMSAVISSKNERASASESPVETIMNAPTRDKCRARLPAMPQRSKRSTGFSP